MPYSNVLIAVEPNDEARAIIQKAKSFAASAELSVLTVIPSIAHAYGNAWTSDMSALVIDAMQSARRKSRDKIRQIALDEGIPDDHIHVLEGHPAPIAHELARELNADCIVAGSHGQHGTELFFGSTANALIHGLECDAFLVHVNAS